MINNKVKKLISGVLALSIGVSGNGIVGFADEIDTKSTEQTINFELTGISSDLKTALQKRVEQVLAKKDFDVSPDMWHARPTEEFKPEELTVSGKSANNPYLAQVIKDLNKFIKEYKSKATREEKREFAIRNWDTAFTRCCVFKEEYDYSRKGKFRGKFVAEQFKQFYILLYLSENPYFSDTMKKIAEIQKIYDSKETNEEKLAFVEEEKNKSAELLKALDKNYIDGDDNNLRVIANIVKFLYLSFLHWDLKSVKGVCHNFQKFLDSFLACSRRAHIAGILWNLSEGFFNTSKEFQLSSDSMGCVFSLAHSIVLFLVGAIYAPTSTNLINLLKSSLKLLTSIKQNFLELFRNIKQKLARRPEGRPTSI